MPFIAIEGLDGSGISTQSRLLKTNLEKLGRKVLLTKEPSNTVIGKLIRERLKRKDGEHKWLQMLFAADRAKHVQDVLRPAINKKFVVCDRYILSQYAYGVLSFPIQSLKAMNRGFPRPGLTLILRVSPKECLSRIRKARAGVELFEGQKLLAKVWKNYLRYAKEFPNVKIIDGERQPAIIAEEVLKAAKKLI